MVKSITLVASLFLASLSWGQYSTSYVSGATDITGYLSTVNAWRLLPGGGVCVANTLTIAPDGTVYCLGWSGGSIFAFSYDLGTQVWTKLTSMGTSLKQIVSTGSNIYSLQATSYCTAQGWGYGVFHWTGSAWVQVAGCIAQFTASADGSLAGRSATSGAYLSTDGGATWPQIGSGMTYVASGDNGTICGVSGGHVYTYGTAFTLLQSQPAGTVAGCAVAQGDPILVAWNTAGAVSLYNYTAGTWSTVTGLSASQIVTSSKASTLALNSAGNPYHLNIYAGYIAGTTSGSYTQCPGFQTCPGGVVHTIKIQVQLPGGINGLMATASGAPTQNLNATSWDASPLCDPFTDPNSPNCTPSGPVAGNGNSCSVGGTIPPGPPTPPHYEESEDYVSWNGTKNISAPVLIHAPDTWSGNYTCYVNGACKTGTAPACPVANIHGTVTLQPSTSGAVAFVAGNQCNLGPWSILSVYKPGSQPTGCVKVVTQKGVKIPGNCF